APALAAATGATAREARRARLARALARPRGVAEADRPAARARGGAALRCACALGRACVARAVARAEGAAFRAGFFAPLVLALTRLALAFEAFLAFPGLGFGLAACF